MPPSKGDLTGITIGHGGKEVFNGDFARFGELIRPQGAQFFGGGKMTLSDAVRKESDSGGKSRKERT